MSTSAAVRSLPLQPSTTRERAAHPVVNDIHSALNETRLERIVPVSSTAQVQAAVDLARSLGRGVCVAGGRHAMGGQQFLTDGVLVDTRPLRTECRLDGDRGLLTVDAGIQWPELVGRLLAMQQGRREQWGIIQKQTGADRLSIGGAIAANVHGRGLTRRPFIADVERFTLVGPDGVARECSRNRHPELFRLAAGGYGLLGIVTSATLRLERRQKVRRHVEILRAPALMATFADHIAGGARYGDFQFDVNPDSPGYLQLGVFSCYEPVPLDTAIPHGQRALSEADWRRLLQWAHADKSAAWTAYASHYLATAGQVYWADTHQLSTYVDDYHRDIDAQSGSAHRCSEMISEIYVPRHRLADFLAEAAEDFREHAVDCVYGTVRLIERDDESVLAWAREPWACVIFNLHTEHSPRGLVHSADAFRRLIDMAVRRGGSYYLTYHRWATREQVLACHPRLPEFLRRKAEHDPDGLFQSDWYRHHLALLS